MYKLTVKDNHYNSLSFYYETLNQMNALITDSTREGYSVTIEACQLEPSEAEMDEAV